jgi:thermostable 8-oxoguanine DNA glycosylase
VPFISETERRAAEFFDEKLQGFGPKQSRNLIQGLGLSRYEIPMDSRITKWLNAFGFPVNLTANALSDRNYYNFVSEGLQSLCEACGIMPCVLDAAIFSSFDGDEWTEENVVW